MKRTRKWAYVAQEATRLRVLGLSPRAIADRLDVNKSSVTRWIKEGKLAGPISPAPAAVSGLAPDGWAAEVRRTFALSATDDQLVMIGEACLCLAHDVRISVRVQLAAIARFQSIVKQLGLQSRPAAVASEPPPKAAVVRPWRARGAGGDVDPRTLLR